MNRWYRIWVATMALAATVCTAAAVYACTRMVRAGGQLLSNETLIRAVQQWWSK